jgi:hypothetical protein
LIRKQDSFLEETNSTVELGWIRWVSLELYFNVPNLIGSSEKTGNKGLPATPRDGAPIELVAMLYSTLRFLEELNEKGNFKY